MALAVSYTNESYQAQACHALTMWIQNNPEYANLRGGPRTPENLRFASSFMSKELHEETTKLYIKAARQKQGSTVDPDVQVGNHISDTIGVQDSSNNFPSGWSWCFVQPIRWLWQSYRLFPSRSLRQAYRCSVMEQVVQVVICILHFENFHLQTGCNSCQW